jgi:hypothetical protein
MKIGFASAAFKTSARFIARAVIPVWAINALLIGIIGIRFLAADGAIAPISNGDPGLPSWAEPQPTATPTQRPGPRLTAEGFPLPAGVDWTDEHEQTLRVWASAKALGWGPDAKTSNGRLMFDVLEEIPDEILAAESCRQRGFLGCRPVPWWAMPAWECDPWPHEGCILEYGAGNYPLADTLFYYP